MAIKYKTDPNVTSETVADFLQRQIPAATAGYLHQLLKKGKVLRDGKPVGAGEVLKGGETLVLPESGRLRQLIELSAARPAAPVILYEDDQLLIADKPAGLAVHASEGHEEVNLIALLEERAAQRKEKFKIAPVHRLDLETSGAILFGKGRKALGELGELVMSRQLKKTYLALVSGSYSGPEELVSSVKAKGKVKDARMRVKVLGANREASLLEIDLLTGRQHQIRQQLGQLGHPLFGDRRYHGTCPAELSRVFLHSWRLAFHSPFGGEPISVTAPLPNDLTTFLLHVGIEKP